MQPRRKAKILGLGLDNDDGHIRVTRGENFHLVGGSRQTHEGMQEKCVKLNEQLRSKGKAFEDLERGELADLAGQCGMNLALPPERPG